MSATISSLRTLKPNHSAGPPPPRPPGWSEHPSNPAPMPPPDGLEPALSFEALLSIASGLAWAQKPVPGDLGDTAAARSLRLIATARYDVWLITWPAGSGLGPHDHGGARSVLHVVEGELIETFADQLEERPPRTRLLRAGDSTCGETSYLHDLENRSGREATSVHVYSPPLSDLTLFQRFSSDEDHRRKKPVPARSARATGSDLGLLKAPALSLVEA